MMFQQLNISTDTLFPLRRWIEVEVEVGGGTTIAEGEHRKEVILRKTTVAYGIAELVRHARAHPGVVAPTPLSVSQQCSADNFVVREAAAPASGRRSQTRRRSVKGVDMLSPQLSVNISEPSFLSRSFTSGFSGQDADDQVEHQIMGRYLEAEFSSDQLPLPDLGEAAAVSQNEEDARCYSLGVLLYELFSHNSSLPDKRSGKKARLSKTSDSSGIGENNTTSARVGENLSEMGFPHQYVWWLKIFSNVGNKIALIMHMIPWMQ